MRGSLIVAGALMALLCPTQPVHAAEQDPAVVARIGASLLITDAPRWKAAGLQTLYKTLDLPELAPDQAGNCVRTEDSKSSQMLLGVSRIGLTSQVRLGALLQPGGVSTKAGMPVAGKAAEGRTLAEEASLAGDGSERPKHHDIIVGFESLEDDGTVVLSYAVQTTWPRATGKAARTTSGGARHEIVAQGTARLRPGESYFCRTTISPVKDEKPAKDSSAGVAGLLKAARSLVSADDAPVDAIFILTVDGVEGVAPQAAAQPRQVK